MARRMMKTSPLFEILKNSHVDMTTANLCDKFASMMPFVYLAKSLADEANGMVESAELFAAYVLKPFMKHHGHLAKGTYPAYFEIIWFRVNWTWIDRRSRRRKHDEEERVWVRVEIVP